MTTREVVRCAGCDIADDLPKHHHLEFFRRRVSLHRACCGCGPCASQLLALERWAVDHGVTVEPRS